MTDLVIRSGGIKPYRATVNEDGRLLTQAQTKAEIVHFSEVEGRAYTLVMGKQTLASTAYHVLMQATFEDPDRHFHIHRLGLGWNGGNTNHNRFITARTYIGTPAPTSNNSDATPSTGINFTKTVPPLMTAHKWNGVGTGMVVAANGALGLESIFGPGFTDVILSGSMIFGNQGKLSVGVEAEEVGDVAFLLSGWFSEEGH